MSLSRCRVVLVRPHYAGNVGSVARAMANFGVRDLVLVAPLADIRSTQAVMMSTHGRAILDGVRTVETLDEAIADCICVLSSSGEVGGVARKGFWGSPAEQLPRLCETMDHSQVALVFGPEPHGLTVDEITRGHGMIFVPTDPEHASLNLAQAVAVVLYELRKIWLARDGSFVPNDEPPASFESQERMFEKLKNALTDVRFLWDFRSDGIFHVLRTVIARGQPTQKELQIFHALAQQLKFVAKEFGVPHPTAVPKLGEWRENPHAS